MLSPASPVRIDPQTGVQARSVSARRYFALRRLLDNICQALFPGGIKSDKPQADQAKPRVDDLGVQIDAGAASPLTQGQPAPPSLMEQFADGVIYPDQRPVQGNILDMAGKTLILIQQYSIGHKNDPP